MPARAGIAYATCNDRRRCYGSVHAENSAMLCSLWSLHEPRDFANALLPAVRNDAPSLLVISRGVTARSMCHRRSSLCHTRSLHRSRQITDLFRTGHRDHSCAHLKRQMNSRALYTQKKEHFPFGKYPYSRRVSLKMRLRSIKRRQVTHINTFYV